MPLVRDAIATLQRLGAESPFDQFCLARERMPLEAWALVLRRGDAVRAPGVPPESPPSHAGDLPPIPPLPGPGGGGGGRDGGDEGEIMDR